MPKFDDQIPWQKLYPFDPKRVLIAGCRCHYIDEFSGMDPAATLLFVHGNPTWSFHWRELIRAWRSRYRCIALDHLGSGYSERPNRPLRLADHIDNLVAFLDELDLSGVTLIAQDWGGAIGLGALLRRRDRFSRIVLFNTGAFRPWFIPWRIRLCRTPVLGKLAVQELNLFALAALRMTLARTARLPRAARKGCLAPYLHGSSRRGIYDFVQDIPSSPRHPTWHTLETIERELPSLDTMPILLVWGMQDWCFTPACLEKFREFWPQAEVHPLQDVGHWVVEDAPQDARSVVEEFLAATDVLTIAADIAEPRSCVRLACLLEATAPKPGNVHPAAAFDDLCYGDLVRSARAISGVLQHASALGVGPSILAAVRAMRAAAGSNAYLGTILLLAPLACVPPGAPLRNGIRELLPTLDASHTRDVYEAIRRATPGGLGTADRGEVHGEAPSAPLAEVMSWAAERDLVALQYTSGFATVFDEVAAPLDELLERSIGLLDAIVHVHVTLLATHGDSLIARKAGREASDEAMSRAASVLDAGPIGSENYCNQLRALDAWLRADGHRRNPGTTADLLAAGLFVLLREGRIDPAVAEQAVAAAVSEPTMPVGEFASNSEGRP